MTGWRTALRMAWRETRRAKGRAALVVAMITLPVAALSFAAVTTDIFELTPQERAERLMGAAQAVVSWPYDGAVEQEPDRTFTFPVGTPGPPSEPTQDRLLALLPAGTRAIPDQSASLTVHTATGTGTVDARVLDYTNPLAHGIFRQVSGRAPAASDEVVLTPDASSRVGAGVGGSVRLTDGGRTLRIVGIVEEPDKLAATTIVLRPGALPAAALPVDRADLSWLVATPGPLTWAEVKRLNTNGVVAVSRHVLANPPDQAERYTQRVREIGPPQGVLALVGGLAMLEIILLAGPALAVGARRRRRDLALVAAAGGTPAHVRRIVLADGVVLGAIAAVVGVVLGVAIAAALRPLLESFLGNRSGAFRVWPEALAGLAGLAVVTGVLAALVPAWISARQDVVTALAGRRGITRSRRRWVVVGVVLIAAGAVVVGAGAVQADQEIILIGLIVVELGLVLCTPAMVGLVARLGRWLPLALRIALRDTSRNRTAAAPAISAVMAAVIGSIAISVVIGSQLAQEANASAGRPGDVTVARVSETDRGRGQRELPAEAIAQLRATMPVEGVHAINMPSCGGGGSNNCFAAPRMPAAQACPYIGYVLGRRPTADEQRAARGDARCADYGKEHHYFGRIGTRSGTTAVIDDAAATAVTDIPAGDVDRVRAALRDGFVVVSDPRYLDGGRVTLAVERIASPEDQIVTAPGFALSQRPKAPIAMMTRQTAESLGLGPTWTITTLATTSRMPTIEEQDRLQAALGPDYEISVDRGNETDTQTLMVLAIVAGVIAIGAAALATALAAADGRADLGTLAAVGASPRLRRALSLSQSGVIAGLGSLLGVIAGLGASTAVLFALNQGLADSWPAPAPFPITVPWLNIVVALLVVPLVAMLGAGLLTRSRLPIERRR